VALPRATFWSPFAPSAIDRQVHAEYVQVAQLLHGFLVRDVVRIAEGVGSSCIREPLDDHVGISGLQVGHVLAARIFSARLLTDASFSRLVVDVQVPIDSTVITDLCRKI
jgi:hypothetical protein